MKFVIYGFWLDFGLGRDYRIFEYGFLNNRVVLRLCILNEFYIFFLFRGILVFKKFNIFKNEGKFN